MNFFLFDPAQVSRQLQPFTLTRPVALIRVGIFTMAERWEKLLATKVHICGHDVLEKLWPIPAEKAGIWIHPAWVPNAFDVEMVKNLGPNEALFHEETLLAWHQEDNSSKNSDHKGHEFALVRQIPDALLITQPWHIFSQNGNVLRSDFELITKGRTSAELTDPFTQVYGKENLFIEDGADIKASIINASEGPVYIGKDAQVQEGSVIKGPFALLDHSVVNMGSKMRPDTTIGPFCKVGGEINNAVFFGFSNKAHDGFLGNSVIGEWCNLGADTNNSNLKNNYADVKIWSCSERKMVSTGLQFCGLIMGDHCKTSINSMFNTGTVVGPCSNLFDGGFPPVYVPPFTWGGRLAGFETYRLDKFLEAEGRVYARRKQVMSEEYKSLLQHLFVRSANETREA